MFDLGIVGLDAEASCEAEPLFAAFYRAYFDCGCAWTCAGCNASAWPNLVCDAHRPPRFPVTFDFRLCDCHICTVYAERPESEQYRGFLFRCGCDTSDGPSSRCVNHRAPAPQPEPAQPEPQLSLASIEQAMRAFERVNVAEYGTAIVYDPAARFARAFEPEPEPAEPAPEPEPELDGDAACSACGETGDACGCVECSRCDWRGDSEHVCDDCGRCERCCNAPQCPRCDTRDHDLSICGNCSRCTDGCCECPHCENCGEAVDDTCSACDCCSGCCDHEDGRTADGLFRTRKLTFWPAARTQHKRNPSKRFVAAEIEVARADRLNSDAAICAAADRWRCSIVEDGSLPSGGYEINTTPASGDRFCDQIEDLCSALARDNAKADASCGLHVHVDARDFTFYDMRRVILLYAQLEHALYLTQPASRRPGNEHADRYCAPCGDLYVRDIRAALAPKANKQAIIAALYPGREEQAKLAVSNPRYYKPPRELPRGDKYNDARYYALNIHSWVYRGTLECRMHAGTTRASKIIPWGMLWATILDYAMRTPERDIKRLGLSTLDSQQAFLLGLAPTDEVAAYLRGRWARHGNPVPGPFPTTQTESEVA